MTLFNPIGAINRSGTGWDDPELVEEDYDYSTRQVTLSGTGKLYWEFRLVHDLALGNYVSAPHTATDGNWYHWYDGTNYVWSQTLWTFTVAQIYSVDYDAATPANSWGLRECHGQQDPYTHENQHRLQGTGRINGGDVSAIVLSSTTSANRRPAISATKLLDEDLKSTLPALAAGSYTQCYVDSSGEVVFTPAAGDIIALTGNVPRYNNATAGTLVDLIANQYMNVFVLAIPTSKDAPSQARRFTFWAGQQASGTRSVIDAETTQNLNLGDLAAMAAEFVFIHRFLLRYTAGNWVVISSNPLTGTKAQQISVAGNYLSSVITDSSLTGSGTIADPLAVVGSAKEYYEAVGSVTGTGSVQDLVNVDGETYPWVELEMYCPSHVSATSSNLWCNADTTGTNYNAQEVNATATTVSAANADSSLCQLGAGLNLSPVKMTLNMHAAYLSANRLANIQTSFVASGGTMYLRNRASRWEGTVALTKFSITAPAGAVWHYKLRARKGA